MELQKTTLSLPKDLLQQAANIASKRNISLSSLLEELITDLVKEEKYKEAMQKSFSQMDNAQPLLAGNFNWSRDSLHER